LEPIFAEAFHGRLRLASIRLYETPNCWADISQV
jgi:6-pyruvoyltetrahydropterin/6-carboxytetrahydropterin synthase